MKSRFSIQRQILTAIMLTALLLIGLTQVSRAADFRDGEVIVIEADEVVDDDLFILGRRVEVNGIVKGDLFASGSEVSVNGLVEGSLYITGQTMSLNGTVQGSVYSAGYALTVGPETMIARNLFFGGFSIETHPGSTIGRSFYAGNYQSILKGDIANDAAIGATAFELYGSVGGNVTAEVSGAEGTAPPFMPNFPGSVTAVAPGFRQDDEAQIGGDLIVQTDTAMAEANTSISSASGFGRRLGEFIALLLVGGLLLRFTPAVIQQASQIAQARPLPSMGWGALAMLIFFFAIPIVAAIVIVIALLVGLITVGHLLGLALVIGLAILVLVISGCVFVLMLVTKAAVAYLGGRLAVERFAPQMEAGFARNFIALVTGVLAYEILRAIPFGLGWLIGVVVTLVGLGAIYLMLRGETATPSVER